MSEGVKVVRNSVSNVCTVLIVLACCNKQLMIW